MKTVVRLLACPAPLALLLLAAGFAAPAPAQATSTENQKLFASTGSDFASFGRDIAVDGNVALLSAAGADNHGAVYCYRKVGGAWTFSQKFTGSDTAQGDMFGWRVALDEGIAVIGSSQNSDLGLGAGAAYVFHDTGSAWVQDQKLVASDPAGYDKFGWAVAIHGGLIVVGASQKDDAGFSSGAAYVYRHTGNTWAFEQKLTASTADTSDQFGWAVDTDGTSIFVSAIQDEKPAVGETGAVFVFKQFAGTWQEAQQIVPDDAGAGDSFGWDLDLDGTTLAVGSPNHDDPIVDGGAVYVFRDGASGWAQQDEFTPSKLEAGNAFGWSVALQDDRIVAGAPSTGVNYDGALYMFHDDGSRFVEVHQWLTSDEAVPAFPPAQLGMSCAIGGKTAFGGAPFHDGSVTNAGAVYAYDIKDIGLQIDPPAVLPNGLVQLQTSGGLALASMGVVLQDVSGSPFNLLLFLSTFDANGKHVLPLVIPAGASGLNATFLSLGFWQGTYKGISNPATLTFL